MAKCKGPCSKQQYDTQNIAVDMVTADANNPPGCANEAAFQRSADGRRAITAAKDALKLELEAEEILVNCADTDPNCTCSYQRPPDWGDWVDGESTKSVTVGLCTYTVKFKYQIRGRIVNGACVPRVFVAAAIGVVPEDEIVVSIGAPRVISGKALEKIKDILT